MKIILLKKIIKHYLNKIYISAPILTTNVLNQIAHVFDHGFWAHGFQPMVSSISFHERLYIYIS
jgi:hypothetical protein